MCSNVHRSLPNWIDLQAQKVTYHRRRPLRREETTEEESPEDIRQRNMKEAEILASNLGEGGINTHEILSDVGQLKGLAQLQESMASLATVWSMCVIQSGVHRSVVHVHCAELCALCCRHGFQHPSCCLHQSCLVPLPHLQMCRSPQREFQPCQSPQFKL